jgi:uncharacterized protein (UPF0216 family)
MPLDTEGSLRKLMEIEYRNINAGMVPRGRKLKDLLREDAPACTAKDGSSYRFDKRNLHDFAEKLTEDEREKLMLPMTLTFTLSLSDSCYLTDETASAVLRRLEGFGSAYRCRDGKMWMPASLGMHLIRKYGRIIQRFLLP